MHEIKRQMEEIVQCQLREEAKRNSASQVVKIVNVAGSGYYDVESADGDGVKYAVSNQVPRTKWQVGNWVTIENSGIGWSIVGISPSSGA